MAAKPWMTSSDLIESVKRRITAPISQALFTESDILAFANEEMQMTQVPSMLQAHEEYFVYNVIVPLISGQARYPIPDRAIGGRLRDIFYVDRSGNPFQMTRTILDDQAEYGNQFINSHVYRFRLEGYDIVLDKTDVTVLTGSLKIVFFLRPNQLVINSRAATIQYFIRDLSVNNASLTAGDKLIVDSVTYTAGTSFAIGASSDITALNIGNMLVATGNYAISIVSNILTVKSLQNPFTCTSSSAGVVVSKPGVICDQVPSNIVGGTVVDILQTKPGHKIYDFDIQLPINGISGLNIYFNEGDLPPETIVGDYVCQANECIIPQIPPDLHTMLAELTAQRALSALGDQAGLAASTEKLKSMKEMEGTLVDQRVDGNPIKFNARKGLLGYNRLRNYRGY